MQARQAFTLLVRDPWRADALVPQPGRARQGYRHNLFRGPERATPSLARSDRQFWL